MCLMRFLERLYEWKGDVCVHSVANHPFLFPYSSSSNIWMGSVPLKSLPGIDQEGLSCACTELNHVCLSLHCTVTVMKSPSPASVFPPWQPQWFQSVWHRRGIQKVCWMAGLPTILFVCMHYSKVWEHKQRGLSGKEEDYTLWFYIPQKAQFIIIRNHTFLVHRTFSCY